jgi:Holliday junction DNA helicase RuvA
MIRQIRGTVLEIGGGSVVLDVVGFGVEVFTTTPESLVLGSTVTLYTHLAVKQDGLELYGFHSRDDLRFFELTLSVSGVGPKTAIALLRKAPRESLEIAIGKRDITYLTRIAGLGKKAAEKLVVEIGEKLGVSDSTVQGDDTEIFDTLVALGYTDREARKAVHGIPSTLEGKEARLKAALGFGK